MDGEDNLSDSLLHIDKNAWEETTAQVIQSIEERCSKNEYEGAVTQFGAQSEFTRPWNIRKPRKSRSRAESAKIKIETEQLMNTNSDKAKKFSAIDDVPVHVTESALGVQLDDIKYIDDSAKSSLSTSLTEAPAPILQPQNCSTICRPQSPQHPVEKRSCASVLEERYCQAFISSKNEQIAESWNRHYASPCLPANHHPYVPKFKHEPRLVVSPLPPEKLKHEKDAAYAEADYYSRNSIGDSEHLNVQNFYIEKDFR